jgi:hydrogenase expression/formation protein HypC
MCLAVPVKVVEVLDGDLAVGEQQGVQVEFSTALLDGVKPGDYVLVHTGIAIETLDRFPYRARWPFCKRFFAAGAGASKRV